MTTVFRETLAAVIISHLLLSLWFPHLVASWVFDFQAALFELQLQAAEEAMK